MDTPTRVFARRERCLDVDLRHQEYRQLRRSEGLGLVAHYISRCTCGSLSMAPRAIVSVSVDGEVSRPMECPSCKVTAIVHLAGWVPEPQGAA